MNQSSEVSNQEPMVSVVMCFFNPLPPHFREAIESVRMQTYPAWELLLIDNGTTNGSEAEAKKYAGQFPNIRVFEHPNRENKGPAASRNLGMREASGELIAFLDADDFWQPDKLTQQVEAMLAHPSAALSFGGMLRWYNGDDGRKDEEELHTSELEVLPPGALIHRLLRNECIPGMSALMVRSAGVKLGADFEESLLWAEDQTISYKLGLHYECLILPDWKVKYRQHPASTTTHVISEGRLFSDHMRFLDWVKGYFTAAKVRDPELWKALRRLRGQYRWLALKQRLIPSSLRNALRRILRRG